MIIAKEQTNSIIDLSRPIEVVEREFMKHEQVKCDVIHRFAPGQYIREVHLPAGSVVIGHHQNFQHLNIFIKGRVAMRQFDGSFVEMKAPMIFVGEPGRKIGYVYEDVVWLNIYPTDETDVERLESTFLTKSDAWIESAAARDQIILLQSGIDRKDFSQAIKELGLSKEMVRAQSTNPNDQIDLPFGGYKIKVANSKIEGKGIFATGDIANGETIAPARISGRRTIAGRYTNHSVNPNARMVCGLGNDIDLVAIREITGCHGGLDGEEITINYREAYALTRLIGKVD